MTAIRVLIVDDSPTMRRLVAHTLSSDPDIVVVGEAADPLEARAAIKALNPDVVTLDVEMPNMDGLEFLDRLMRLRPTPVIMVSTLTQRGADAALRALELGAVDCVGKPVAGSAAGEFHLLPEKVRAAFQARLRPKEHIPAPGRTGGGAPFRGNGRMIAVGASTGGVEALITLLSRFPVDCPATLITQHMPASFTRSFAARLDKLCPPRVEEARDGAVLAPGQVYLAPGGDYHLELSGRSCRLVHAPTVNGHRPSVDVLFHSVAKYAGASAAGVILTGMGRDGAEGLLAMRGAGATTFGQDEASCVVYGMPKSAAAVGAVEHEAPLGRLADLVLDACSSRSRAA